MPFICPGPTKKMYLSPIFSDRPDLKNGLVGPSNIDSSHPRMENSILLPPSPATVNTESLITSQCSKSFGRARQKKYQLIVKQNVQLLAWTVSGKKYLYQKSLPFLLPMPEAQGQFFLTNWPYVSGIADVLGKN